MKIASIPFIDHENSFWESFNDERVNSTRVVIILGSILLVVHSVFDYFNLPTEKLPFIYSVRALGIFALLVIFYLSYKAVFLKHYNKIKLSGYYVAGTVVSIGIYLSEPGEYIYNTYS